MDTSLVLGFFDGIHSGHKEVIKSAVKNCTGKTILLTLKDSPKKFFDGEVKYISKREESYKIAVSLGIDEVVAEDFSEIHFMSAYDYLNKIVKKYNPKSIITGFNYTFGKNKTGTTSFIKEYQTKFGYDYHCINPFYIDNELVSSSIIKKYLKEGNIKKANKLLDRNFSIEGLVIFGAQLGRKLGFPTANIKYPEIIEEIPYGVYAVKTLSHAGIMNYGIKPTIHGACTPVVEVHILNFDEDLYNKNIKIEIIDKIRDEQKFESLEDLKNQIIKDKDHCLKLLS